MNLVLMFYSSPYVGYGIGVALLEEFYNNFVDVIHKEFVQFIYSLLFLNHVNCVNYFLKKMINQLSY
jgi:hypothetical protein